MPAFIDLPNRSVPGRPFTIAGWVASHHAEPTVSVHVGGIPVPFSFYPRPDVRQALAPHDFAFTAGIMASVGEDLAMVEGAFTVEVVCDGETAMRTCRFAPDPAPPPAAPSPSAPSSPAPSSPAPSSPETSIHERWSPGPSAADRAEAARVEASRRRDARAWIAARLRCPRCGAIGDRLDVSPARIACRACRAAWPQEARAFDFLSVHERQHGAVVPTGNVSSNPYTPDALALIARATDGGGWVLDCGAGARPERLARVVNVEIVDYPSTDVLSIGETLPFRDGVFDAVLSLAVLEHVRDPFACARELLRVLKPGGEILADVPFLQPVHGYPHHFYNMTQTGLRNLFGPETEVLDCRVPPHGHPIFGVQWLLGAYLGALPDEARTAFATMTVGEAASLVPHRVLGEPFAALLARDAQASIACLNTIRLRKPA